MIRSGDKPLKRHHQLKTHGGWLAWPDHPDVTGQPGGEPVEHTTEGNRPPPCNDAPPGWTWRTPAGFLIHDEPEPPLDEWDE